MARQIGRRESRAFRNRANRTRVARIACGSESGGADRASFGSKGLSINSTRILGPAAFPLESGRRSFELRGFPRPTPPSLLTSLPLSPHRPTGSGLGPGHLPSPPYGPLALHCSEVRGPSRWSTPSHPLGGTLLSLPLARLGPPTPKPVWLSGRATRVHPLWRRSSRASLPLHSVWLGHGSTRSHPRHCQSPRTRC